MMTEIMTLDISDFRKCGNIWYACNKLLVLFGSDDTENKKVPTAYNEYENGMNGMTVTEKPLRLS